MLVFADTVVFVDTIWAFSEPDAVTMSAALAEMPELNAPDAVTKSAFVAFVARELVTVVEKFASSPRAAANSLRVSNAAGDESTRLITSVLTNAVVAI